MNWLLYVDTPLWTLMVGVAVWSFLLRRKLERERLSYLQATELQPNNALLELWSKQLTEEGGSLVDFTAYAASMKVHAPLDSLNESSTLEEKLRRKELLRGESEGFNKTIDLLYRASGIKIVPAPTHVDKCNLVMIYNDRQTPDSAKAWFQRAFELTL